MKKIIPNQLTIFLLIFLLPRVSTAENADIIVAQDGSGDFTTIQKAIDSIPANNDELKIILIKNGIYIEKLIIETDFIALVGEDRDSTRIEYDQPYDFDSTYPDGRAVINIFSNDITIANLTAENIQPDVDIHAFTIYGTNNTRTIVINCNILSNGGDTMALWNGYTGMYYHNTLYLKGAVDFLCPRGWSYAENIDFYCTRNRTPLWHDGSKNQDQKSVVKNATFDGATKFSLGRNHHDGAFYLSNCTFSENMLDNPFFLPASAPGPYKWGRRAYFNNCIRPAGNYDWHKNNMITAEGSPKPEEITPVWTFGGAWNPEATLPSVLPMSFLPKPDNNQIRVDLNPLLTWIPGRNSISHKVYIGTNNPPEFTAGVTECYYNPGTLQPNTIYFWKVDEITDNGVIEGRVWQFRTRTDQLPKKASQPFLSNKSRDVEGPIEKIMWHADSLETNLQELYWGVHPDSLVQVSSYSVPGYYPELLVIDKTYYWQVDLVNTVGTTKGDLWWFSMKPSEYMKADFVQDDSSDGIVSMEAENYTENVPIGDHTWTLVTDPDGYSGKGAMQALPDIGSFFLNRYGQNCTRLDFSVNFIRSGKHYIWIRAYTKGSGDHAFHMGLNGAEDQSATRIGNFQNINQWEWLNRSFAQTPEVRFFDVTLLGVQRISLWFAWDGALCDKIVLTSNPDYIPEDLGPEQTTDVSLPKQKNRPEDFRLMQNYPNPFNFATRIQYEIQKKSKVILKIVNIQGEHIQTLVDQIQLAGKYTVPWDVSDSGVDIVSSGVYCARLTAGSVSKTIKMVYIK